MGGGGGVEVIGKSGCFGDGLRVKGEGFGSGGRWVGEGWEHLVLFQVYVWPDGGTLGVVRGQGFVWTEFWTRELGGRSRDLSRPGLSRMIS